jgi:hypothetical protein
MGDLIDEIDAAGFDASHSLTVEVKLARLELMKVKSAAEQGLEKLVLDCDECGQRVHWVSGLGATPGHWAHRDPAPRDPPVVAGRP